MTRKSTLLVAALVALAAISAVHAQFKIPVYCDCPAADMMYTDFTSIRPFDFEPSLPIVLPGDRSTFVQVDIDRSTNPLIYGYNIPWQDLTSNPRFFDKVGQQDIKTLVHHSCGQIPSSINFRLGAPSADFLFIIYGISSTTNIQLKGKDKFGSVIDMQTWNTVDRGILHRQGMGANSLIMGNKPGSLSLDAKKDSTHPYVILHPNEIEVSSIEVTATSQCLEPKCEPITLFYSLVRGVCKTKHTPGDIHDTFTLSTRVTIDSNGNSLQDDGDNRGFPGVTVALYSDKDVFIASGPTDETGNINFNNVPPGKYYPKIMGDYTYSPAKGQNAFVNGKAPILEYSRDAPGVSKDKDGTYHLSQGATILPQKYVIQGAVFYDVQGTGSRLSAEGFPGVCILLLDEAMNQIKNTTTDQNGNYAFINLLPGTYNIQIVPPEPKYAISTGVTFKADAEGLIKKIQLNAMNSELVVVNAKLKIDSQLMSINNDGALTLKQNYGIGRQAFIDVNKDGNYDPVVDLPLANIEVNLACYDCSPVMAPKKIRTAADGTYLFTGLTQGTYRLFFNPPIGLLPTKLGGQSMVDGENSIDNLMISRATTVSFLDSASGVTRANLDGNAGFMRAI
eukprot:gene8161-9588_t